MNPPTRRLNYFDHQFLHVDDFADEQAYHLGMRRAHNALLHAWGVAYGLALSHAGERVTVSPGVAIDSSGREMVLGDGGDLQVPRAMAGTTAWVLLSYDERDADFTSETGASGYRRREEVPSLVLADAAPADPSLKLVLGRVMVDATGLVASTDDGVGATRRRAAGPAPITELEVSRLTVTGPARVAGGTADLAAGEGDLRVGNDTHRLKVGVTLIGAGAGDVRLWAHGGTGRLMLGSGADVLAVQNGGVAIGTGAAAPDATLHVAGGRAFATTDGDLKVGTGTNRLKVGVEVAGATAGTARLRAEGTAPKLILGAAGADVLTVSSTGVAIATGGKLAVGVASALEAIHTSGSLRIDAGEIKSLSGIVLRPDTDNSGDCFVRVVHPSGTELMSVASNGNLTAAGRVSDAKVRTQAPIAYDRISVTNNVNNYAWSNVPGMQLTLGGGTFLVMFDMGGVEPHGVTQAIADFRLWIDASTQAVYVTESYDSGSYVARIVSMTALVTLAAGSHTVVVQWGVRSPSSPSTNPTLWGCWNNDHRSLIAVEL